MPKPYFHGFQRCKPRLKCFCDSNGFPLLRDFLKLLVSRRQRRVEVFIYCPLYYFDLRLTLGNRLFPDLRTTRFKNSAEFYSLFLVVWSLHQQKLILKDRRRNQVAMRLLQRFSSGVDEVREQQRNALGAEASQRIYADYLLLVQQSTDAVTQRKRRGEMIQHLLDGLFEQKDGKRLFSSEQRRLLWSSEEKKKCKLCGEMLDWANFQVDHIKAYSRGGKTELSNAALTCAPCNASKGAGRKKLKSA